MSQHARYLILFWIKRETFDGGPLVQSVEFCLQCLRDWRGHSLKATFAVSVQ